MSERTGKCLCGAVSFTADPMPSSQACHCETCRTWGGGPFMAVPCKSATFTGKVTRFASSEHGERGFCSDCGSSLFWRAPGDGNNVAISISTLDDGHGIEIMEHIWVDDKPDWYDFADDTPRKTAAQAMAGGD